MKVPNQLTSLLFSPRHNVDKIIVAAGIKARIRAALDVDMYISDTFSAQ